jgi:hypothetical protein
MEDVRIEFYKITEFGFFRWGGQEPPFGELDVVLRDLQRWAAGTTLGLTKTYDPGPNGHLLPAYFLDLRQSHGSWLLSLWNETPSTEGAVASIPATAPVGATDVTMNEIEPGSIPGVAAYFWFIPDRDVVATIRFQHPGSCRAQMRSYLRAFMASFCSYAVTEEDEDGQVVTRGYRGGAGEPIVKARPRLSLAPYKKPAERQFLIDRAHNVRKILKKGTLVLVDRIDRALWQRLLDAAHITVPSVRPHEVEMAYDVEVEGLTEQDIANVIDSFDDEDGQNDYGFKFQGEGAVHWLGKEVARDVLSLDITRVNPEMIDPEQLMHELDRHRRRLLAILQ